MPPIKEYSFSNNQNTLIKITAFNLQQAVNLLENLVGNNINQFVCLEEPSIVFLTDTYFRVNLN